MPKISDANSSSQAFLERINKRKEFGTIVRLTFGHSTDPPIDDLRVDTQTWMNRVINNVTAEDSIVKLSGSTDYHNFLLLSAEDRSSCSHSADDTLNMDHCFAYLMKKPADINGAIVDDLIKIDRQMNRKQNEDNKAKEKISDTLGTEINFANALRKSGIIQDVRKVAGKSSQTGRGITHNVKTPDNESESKTGSYWLISPEIEQHVKELLSGQPKYSPDSLVKIETKIADAQASVLNQWIEFRQAEGQSTKMAYSELLQLLSEVRKQCLSIISQQCVFPRTSIKDVKLLPKDSFSELAVEPDQWLEREALLHVEDTVKKIQRYKSTDSLGGLMPPAKDDSVTLDVSEFLKYFKADGSSVADNLKPVHFGRSKQSHQVDGSLDPDAVSTMRWPEVKRRCYHDMYYNNDDTTAERKEQKANRIRSRYIGNETGSTCNVHQRSQPVTIAQLTNAAKREKERDLKEQEKLSNDVAKKGKRKRIGESTPSVNRNSLQSVRQSARKSKDGASLEDPVQMSARNRKILVPVKAAERKKAVNQPKDARRGDCGREEIAAQFKMSAKAQSSSQPASRESRSERHRRKLEEIVTATLVANGITTDHSLYTSCKTRLYKLTKMYVMDLTTSRNLKEEMKKIAEDHVKQVISFETKRIDPTAS
ncbi:mdm2-binding protein-like isoform X1 [Lingula anatina]|uniref:Mdm2-binding protein-like isoform X1 n=1 Tax=Lingula anatina TaxID=7574 RepID=A0A1S3IXU3_LINAN|nr:mdm2-binding protein-like isoform X1 [Lingula anatina]|eukprot:XP_013402369.1 mdm2-binding protein-like isoform X1 [Lingula anatina]